MGYHQNLRATPCAAASHVVHVVGKDVACGLAVHLAVANARFEASEGVNAAKKTKPLAFYLHLFNHELQ